MLLPNPLTPMVYLTPAQADEYQTIGYIYIASLGVGIFMQRIFSHY